MTTGRINQGSSPHFLYIRVVSMKNTSYVSLRRTCHHQTRRRDRFRSTVFASHERASSLFHSLFSIYGLHAKRLPLPSSTRASNAGDDSTSIGTPFSLVSHLSRQLLLSSLRKCVCPSQVVTCNAGDDQTNLGHLVLQDRHFSEESQS